MITDFSRAMLRLHGYYRNRILPFAGGLLDQPNGYVEAMETIEKALNDGTK